MKKNEISCNYFKWGRRGLRGKDGGGDLTNVQCKPIWNHHNESSLYNKYILIKNLKKEKV
jgi:hypothetical protein